MKAVLNKENGLMTGKLLSHVAVFDVPAYHKLLIVTDAAVNISPTLDEKVTLINNAVLCAHAIGIKMPKVAVIAAVEKVNPGKMPCTEHAAILTAMNRRGQITDCIVDGPFGFDNAISKHSADLKGIGGPVAGDADIILADDIESANILYKSLNFMANAECAALVLGASAPVVLTSRADDQKSKLASLALGVANAS
jgi:phosphate butyryltransferase